MGSPKKTISYRFDSVGNRVGMTDPDGGRFTYTYDAVNRISHLVNPQGDRTTYAYDSGGRRTVKKLANGTRASFTYDTVSNLTRPANLKSDGTTISSFNYNYDKMGNRTAVLEADGSRVTWSYDDTYQLTGEHRTGSHAYRDTYTYDPAGNRLLKIHDGARTTYSYDAANQLEWSEDASGRTTYTFDADGNQERVLEPNGDRTTTSWDYENRTTLVQLPAGIRNTMAYEPGGLRVKLEESTGTKKFAWDDQNYLAETDGNDDTQVVYTNEPRVYGNLVSQRRSTDSHWYHFDAIGSTRELTNSGEAVTDTRLYDAWGALVRLTGNTSIAFGFVGRLGYQFDSNAARHYVRFRHYSGVSARWLSLDPEGFVDALNRYSYCTNNPASCSDPSGSRCEISVHCFPALGYLDFHCGLTLDTDQEFDNPRLKPPFWLDGRPDVGTGEIIAGSGGAGHVIIVTLRPYPADGLIESTPTSFPDSTCRCLKEYMSVFTDADEPYDTSNRNSNWALKCMTAECGIVLRWGVGTTMDAPPGWNCRDCVEGRWEWRSYPEGPGFAWELVWCCERYEPCECPTYVPPPSPVFDRRM